MIGVGMFFLLIKPAKLEFAKQKARYDAAYPDSLQEPQARRDLDNAIREVNETQEKLESYMAAKMPLVDFTDRATGMIQLWHEQCETLGPLLESYARRTGVRVLTPHIPVPAPPVNPNDPTLQATTIVLPLGTVQVQGSFRELLDHIRKWNNCNRLVMTSPPKLTGESPYLNAEYTLTAFIFPRGQPGPPVAMAGGQEAAAGTPGAPMMPTMPAGAALPATPPMPSR